MKFAAIVVVLALALGIEASGLAWGSHYAPALSYTAVSGPALHAAPALLAAGPATAWGNGAWDGRAWGNHGSWAAPAAISAYGSWAAPAATAYGAWAAPAAIATHGSWAAPAATAYGAWAAPAAIATHGAIIPAAHSTWGHEGSYVAKTRGAVHVAPLAGHANSAASINLQPAPGTI